MNIRLVRGEGVIKLFKNLITNLIGGGVKYANSN